MSESVKKKVGFREFAELAGVDRSTVILFVQREWIRPAAEDVFDQEDLARLRLIQELRESFGVNDEAIPLILHLMDQLYCLRNRIRESGSG